MDYMISKRIGQLIPNVVGILFGSLWGLLAAVAAPHQWVSFAIAGTFVVGIALIVRLWLQIQAGASSGGALFRRQAYLAAVALEVAAIVAASALLPRLHFEGYLPSVVGLIVGFHFIGLWKATGNRDFLAITVAMCLISTISILLPRNWHMFDLRHVFLGGATL
jgi:hypothetical protein